MDNFLINHNTYNDFYKTITSLQAIAVLWVIFTHWALAVNIPKLNFWYAICYIGEFGFIIFIFLSGFLLNMKKILNENQEPLWRGWYKKRIIRIYPGLILATFMVILYRFLIFQNRGFNINIILIHISGFQSIPINPRFYSINYIHWFITLIIVCYLFFPLFHYLIKKNYRISLISSLILYIIYVIFYDPFTDFSKKMIEYIFVQELNTFQYTLFVPNFFVYFFGMSLGHWVGKSNMKKIEILRMPKIQLIFSILLIILCHLYIIVLFLNQFILARLIFYPAIGINLVFFGISTFKNKNRFNKILDIPGKNSYALILIQMIPLDINLYLIVTSFGLRLLDFWYISIPLIIAASILLALPITYFGEFIKTNIKYHYSLIILVISFIIYAAFSFLLILFQNMFLDNIFSILLYLSILIPILLISKKYNISKKKLNEKSINTN